METFFPFEVGREEEKERGRKREKEKGVRKNFSGGKVVTSVTIAE